MADKIKYGIKKCYYAKITETAEDGTPTYAAPVALPGAVALTMSAEGGLSPFYADDIVYFTTSSNNGYSGDLEIALIPDKFREEILGETLQATDNVLVEKANAPISQFALLFEFATPSGKPILNVLYNCTATRSGIEGSTKTDTIEPTTDKITINATPLGGSELVKAKTSDTTTEEVRAAWYTAVWMLKE